MLAFQKCPLAIKATGSSAFASYRETGPVGGSALLAGFPGTQGPGWDGAARQAARIAQQQRKKARPTERCRPRRLDRNSLGGSPRLQDSPASPASPAWLLHSHGPSPQWWAQLDRLLCPWPAASRGDCARPTGRTVGSLERVAQGTVPTQLRALWAFMELACLCRPVVT